MKNLLLAAFAAFGGVIILFGLRRYKLRFLLLSALCGFAALLAADFICGLFDFNLPINAFSIAVSAVGGLPGVILLNALTAFFKYCA